MIHALKFLLLIVVLSIFLFNSPTYASSNKWGKISNLEHRLENTRGVFFFAGPPNPNSKALYTRTPLNNHHFNWNSQEDIDFIFNQLQSTNANVIKLSWWGVGNEYKQWAPTWNSASVNNQTFKEATKRNMLVAPVLEVHPDFKFWQEYPNNTANLETRIKQVLSSYAHHPNWLTIYDQNGQARKVIWLIETIHVGSIDEEKFASIFDQVANRIQSQTGHKIGFIIDPTPLPPNGSYTGPNPTHLLNTQSLLAINPFNITSDGNTEPKRLEKSEQILKKWSDSNIPLMAPVLPGYDDHIVRPPGQVYGDTPTWRDAVHNLAKKYNTAGITLDIWNGFTEGYTFVPTIETGTSNYDLAKVLFNAPTITPEPTLTPTPKPTLTPTPTQTPTPTITLKPNEWDLNQDSFVNLFDFSHFILNFNSNFSFPSLVLFISSL